MEIIKAYSLRFYAIIILLLAANHPLFAGETVLRRVPALRVEQVPAYPRNLARYNLGAAVEAAPKPQPIATLQLSSSSRDENAAEAALLCEDPTVGYALPAGRTTLLVSLPQIENLGSISFENTGARGDVTVATSNARLPENSPQWRTALEQPLSTNAIQAAVHPGEAKYVRITFNITEPGRIYGFGIYPTPRVSDFTIPRSHKLEVQDRSDSFALISYTLTDIHAEARALYVTSGADINQANNVVDGQTSSSYTFTAGDAHPTAIVDLGMPSTLRRLSAVYSPGAGKIEFYVLQNLPGTRAVASQDSSAEDEITPATQISPETLKLDDADFGSAQSVGSVTDDGSRGRASIDFPATSARYVMVRWVPATQDSTFSLAELSAFGHAAGRNAMFAANTRGTSEGELSDGKTMLDGKTIIDAKDIPAEGPEEVPRSPAEGPPPSLPQPPPFTFVPILVPTSP